MASLFIPILLLLMFISLCHHVAAIRNVGYTVQDLQSEQHIQNLFQSWTVKHGKVYKSAAEKAARFQIFKESLSFIHATNSKNGSYWLGLNRFSDLTEEEFKATYANKATMLATPAGANQNLQEDTENLAGSVDWRQKGAVTGVKDQGSCGACWAFASVAAIESINKIARGVLPNLSEQELMDCDAQSYGCEGGIMTDAFSYVRQNGISSESDYPYVEQKMQCQQKDMTGRIFIDGYTAVPRMNEKALQSAVARQPVAVRLRGSESVFRFYAGGILSSSSCGTQPNHEGLIVGYGSQDNLDYWIMKNSWGSGWGEGGYIRFQRNVEDNLGVCGIANYPYYPNISTYKSCCMATGGDRGLRAFIGLRFSSLNLFGWILQWASMCR